MIESRDEEVSFTQLGEEQMTESKQINELAAALAKAQADIKHPLKSNTAGSGNFKYTYADLPAVIDSVVAAFSKHGLSFMQFPSTDVANRMIGLKTMVMHSSGQFMESELSMMVTDLKPQTIGSAITYARRYALSAMSGIAAETDDDGNSVGGVAGKAPGKTTFAGRK